MKPSGIFIPPARVFPFPDDEASLRSTGNEFGVCAPHRMSRNLWAMQNRGARATMSPNNSHTITWTSNASTAGVGEDNTRPRSKHSSTASDRWCLMRKVHVLVIGGDTLQQRWSASGSFERDASAASKGMLFCGGLSEANLRGHRLFDNAVVSVFFA